MVGWWSGPHSTGGGVAWTGTRAGQGGRRRGLHEMRRVDPPTSVTAA